jgi:hypothetical protein
VQTTRILCGSSVWTRIYCGGDMTVVDTVEQAHNPFTPEGVSVVMRERVWQGRHERTHRRRLREQPAPKATRTRVVEADEEGIATVTVTEPID